LVREVIDEFAVFAIFSGENLFQFEDWGIYCDCSVALEDFGDGREDFVSNYHVLALPWSMLDVG
jgi:hypothetical protein